MPWKSIAASIIFGLSMLGYAAGFDCSKARTKTEVMICSDNLLSELDSNLSKAYAELRRSIPDVRIEQNEWLTNVRNKCPTVQCLQEVYEKRIDQLQNRRSCAGYADNIVGHWMALKNSFFEEFLLKSINGSNSFGSWRHNRPEVFGDWKIQGCSLNISGADGIVNIEYTIKDIGKSRLRLINEDGEEEVYTRGRDK